MNGLRVLVVEDEPLIALLLEELLNSLGCDVCAVEYSEAGAVEAARQLQPELMIVDGHLNGGCGVAAVKHILDQGYIPHFFVTGDTRRILALRPGAIAIEKPFFEPDLVNAMNRALAVRC